MVPKIRRKDRLNSIRRKATNRHIGCDESLQKERRVVTKGATSRHFGATTRRSGSDWRTLNGRHFLLGCRIWTYNIPLESSWSLLSNTANLASMWSLYKKLWLKEWACIKFLLKTFVFHHFSTLFSFAHIHCKTSSSEQRSLHLF